MYIHYICSRTFRPPWKAIVNHCESYDLTSFVVYVYCNSSLNKSIICYKSKCNKNILSRQETPNSVKVTYDEFDKEVMIWWKEKVEGVGIGGMAPASTGKSKWKPNALQDQRGRESRQNRKRKRKEKGVSDRLEALVDSEQSERRSDPVFRCGVRAVAADRQTEVGVAEPWARAASRNCRQELSYTWAREHAVFHVACPRTT